MRFRARLIILITRILVFPALYASALPGTAAENIHLLLPGHRIQAEELAIIINDADPLSVRIGNYYQQARAIPPGNVLHIRFKPGRAVMPEAEFQRIKADIDNSTPPRVQAYAVTWLAPYRVGCLSMTTALAFGFDKRFCSEQRCAPTRHSPYYGQFSTQPFTDYGIRPAMVLAATSFEHARALIDRGIASDKTQPAGTAYLLSTTDKARNVRSLNFAKIKQLMTGWIDTEIVASDGLKNAENILFYFTGTIREPYLATLHFVPGAIADHLTSVGGKLRPPDTGKQMSALRWLEAGASGSYGTVVEPCNVPGKFPSPGLLMEAYGAGRTLLEAYWQSVQQPGEGIFIGEPLAAPFDGYTIQEGDDRIRLQTRTLRPGRYRISYSRNPVGPYRTLRDLLRVGYHQQEFSLPKRGPGYYRLQRHTAAH